MNPMSLLIATAVLFVGSHLLLSHPLRDGLASRLGERGFQIVYSIVAFATFIPLVQAWRAMPPEPPLWTVDDPLWALATLIVLFASILFMGSLIGNPALPSPKAAFAAQGAPRGVFAITRHPMMGAVGRCDPARPCAVRRHPAVARGDLGAWRAWLYGRGHLALDRLIAMNDEARIADMALRLLGRAFNELDEQEQRVICAIAERAPTSRNAGEIDDEEASFGDRLADRVAAAAQFERPRAGGARLRSLSLYLPQPDALDARGDPGAGDHDEPESAGGEGPAVGPARL